MYVLFDIFIHYTTKKLICAYIFDETEAACFMFSSGAKIDSPAVRQQVRARAVYIFARAFGPL